MKRIKEPPPEFFRFQQFYNCLGAEIEKCCLCHDEIRKGIHDLVLDKMYCFACAYERGVTQDGGGLIAKTGGGKGKPARRR